MIFLVFNTTQKDLNKIASSTITIKYCWLERKCHNPIVINFNEIDFYIFISCLFIYLYYIFISWLIILFRKYTIFISNDLSLDVRFYIYFSNMFTLFLNVSEVWQRVRRSIKSLPNPSYLGPYCREPPYRGLGSLYIINRVSSALSVIYKNSSTRHVPSVS